MRARLRDGFYSYVAGGQPDRVVTRGSRSRLRLTIDAAAPDERYGSVSERRQEACPPSVCTVGPDRPPTIAQPR